MILRTPAADIARALHALHVLPRRRFSAEPLLLQIGALARIAQRCGVVALDRTVITDRDLAAGIAHLLDTRAPYGTYNLTNAGEPASWADVAAAVFEARGRSADDVTRISTEKYFADKPDAARRPRNSVLNLEKARSVGVVLPPWRDSLATYVKQEVAA